MDLGTLLNGTVGSVLAGLVFTALVVGATLLLTARSED